MVAIRMELQARVKQIRILLADDHTVMRRGLRLLLDSHPGFSVVGEASDGRQAVEQAEATNPKCGSSGYRHAQPEWN